MFDTTALKKAAAAATQPSPWSLRYDEEQQSYLVMDAHGMWVADIGLAPADAEFIAAAHPRAVLALIEHHEQLVALLDRLDRAGGLGSAAHDAIRELIGEPDLNARKAVRRG